MTASVLLAAAPRTAQRSGMTDSSRPVPTPDWRFAVGCAALLTVVFALQMWIAPPASRPELDLGTAFALQAVRWGTWLLLLPAILRSALQRLLDGRPTVGWMMRSTWHGVLFSTLHSLVAGTLRWGLGLSVSDQLLDVLAEGVVVGFSTGFLIYWAILIACQAVAYHRAVRERDQRAAALELELTRASLAHVEATLRPHFLFNTLNTIAALVRDDPRAAEEMIEGLSDLLRASLSGDALQEVPLSDELTLAGQYLEIERVRFQDRLHVSVDASDDARRALVPRFMLQPLVENAVHHGIAPLEDGGSISVSAATADGRLQLSVTDDGVGLGNSPRSGGAGIGLGGLRARLSHLYGDRQRLDVRAGVPRGTVVLLEIPFRTA